MSLIADIKTLFILWRLILSIKPKYILSYTIKPVIYGSVAAWLAGVPKRFALITGLGYAFQGDGSRSKLQALVQRMYAFALARVNTVFFQNPDDAALFKQLGIVKNDAKVCVVNGSGVDLEHFKLATFDASSDQRISFLLIARLLGDKGVREYAQAAQRIRANYPAVTFKLVGWIDENPNAISQNELDAWVAQGHIEFLGRLQDVRPAIAAASVFVLPSYREGTPRTVLEAMAMGRAIITTDAPGCRETVVDGVNGFLVVVKNVDSLEAAMLKFIENPVLIPKMGTNAHALAVSKYDVRLVNKAMLSRMHIEP